MRKKKITASNSRTARTKPLPEVIHLTVKQSNALLNYMSLHANYAQKFTSTMRGGDAGQIAVLLQKIGIRVRPVTARLP